MVDETEFDIMDADNESRLNDSIDECVTVEVSIRTNNVGSECIDRIEIPLKEWGSMSDDDKEELCKETAFGMMGWNYEVVELVE